MQQHGFSSGVRIVHFRIGASGSIGDFSDDQYDGGICNFRV
jgi:hypothetical protein